MFELLPREIVGIILELSSPSACLALLRASRGLYFRAALWAHVLPAPSRPRPLTRASVLHALRRGPSIPAFPGGPVHSRYNASYSCAVVGARALLCGGGACTLALLVRARGDNSLGALKPAEDSRCLGGCRMLFRPSGADSGNYKSGVLITVVDAPASGVIETSFTYGSSGYSSVALPPIAVESPGCFSAELEAGFVLSETGLETPLFRIDTLAVGNFPSKTLWKPSRAIPIFPHAPSSVGFPIVMDAVYTMRKWTFTMSVEMLLRLDLWHLAV